MKAARSEMTLLRVLPSANRTASAQYYDISWLNFWPACSPTDASAASSRMPPHGSGPMWIAIPYIAVDFHHLLLAGFIPARPIFYPSLLWGQCRKRAWGPGIATRPPRSHHFFMEA